MKQKFLFAGTLALILTTATLPSFSADDHANLLGAEAAPSTASRTIVIGPDTAYVNVMHGDIVKFIVGDKTFAWNFNGPARISEIDLNKIAPPGVLNHVVKAYIKRDPATNGG
jgi:hypothetical protein